MAGLWSVGGELRRKVRVILKGLPLVFVPLLVAACGPLHLDSQWPGRPVWVDGSSEEWEGVMRSLEDGTVWLGVANDADYLYMCVMTSQRPLQRQIMSSGFTVWFDNGGSETADFGIRYPTGLAPSGAMASTGEVPREPGEAPAFDSEALAASLASIEILGEGETRRVPLGSIPGLEVTVNGREDWFTYELKVPLRSVEPGSLSLARNPGEEVTMRLVSERPNRGEMRERMGGQGGPPSGGSGFPGGGGMRGGGRRPPMNRGDRESTNLSVKIRVRLASDLGG
ncbi:MAG: hypothetical protein AB1752_12895 [Candidatus Zixiibacteriota bacterium]